LVASAKPLEQSMAIERLARSSSAFLYRDKYILLKQVDVVGSRSAAASGSPQSVKDVKAQLKPDCAISNNCYIQYNVNIVSARVPIRAMKYCFMFLIPLKH